MDGELCRLMLVLSSSHSQGGNFGSALHYGKKAHRIAEKADSYFLLLTKSNLAEMYEVTGEFPTALEYFIKTQWYAAGILTKNRFDHTAERVLASAYAGIGRMYRHLTDWKMAETCYQRLYDLTFRKMLPDGDDSTSPQAKKAFHAKSCELLYDVCLQSWQISKAQQLIMEFYLLISEVLEVEPDNPNFQMSLINAEIALGDIDIMNFDESGAYVHYSEAYNLVFTLSSKYPSDFEYAIAMVAALGRVAETLISQGLMPDALTIYLQQYELTKKLYDQFPGERSRTIYLSLAARRLSACYLSLGDSEKTYTLLIESGKLINELHCAQRGDREILQHLAFCFADLSKYFDHEGYTMAAIAHGHNACIEMRELCTMAPENGRYKEQLVYYWNYLGALYEKQNDPGSAKNFFDKATRLSLEPRFNNQIL